MKNCDDSCSYLKFDRLYITEEHKLLANSMSDLSDIVKHAEKEPIFAVLKKNSTGFIQQGNSMVSYFSFPDKEGCTIMDYVDKKIEDYARSNELSGKKMYLVTDSPISCCLKRRVDSSNGSVFYFSSDDGKINIEKYKVQKSDVIQFPDAAKGKQTDRYEQWIE